MVLALNQLTLHIAGSFLNCATFCFATESKSLFLLNRLRENKSSPFVRYITASYKQGVVDCYYPPGEGETSSLGRADSQVGDIMIKEMFPSKPVKRPRKPKGPLPA